MIGPLFGWELLRLARRGQTVRARGIFTIVILTALFLCTVYRFWSIPIVKLFTLGPSDSIISIEESASFGESFAMTFLIAQLIVLIMLTPAYAAGGLAEEIERRSIDFLLVSDLSNREIVLGPFVARLVFLYAIIFAGLPILLLTLLYGGVDPQIVLSSYAITFSTVTVIAAFSLVAAIYADSIRGAMFRAYGLTFLFTVVGFGCFYLSPVFVLISLRTLRNQTTMFLTVSIGYPLIGLLIAAGMTILAIRKLRIAADGPVRQSPPSELKDAFRPLPVIASKKPPIDDEHPFDWKETYCSLSKRSQDDDAIDGLKIAAMITLATYLIFFSCIGISLQISGKGSSPILSITASIGMMAHLGFVGLTACGRINREKARLTWESIVVIPAERHEILSAKYRHAVRKGWWWGVPSLLILWLIIAGSAGATVWLSAFVYFLVGFTSAPLIGLALSSAVATVTRAFLFFVPFAAAVAFLPITIMSIWEPSDLSFTWVLMAATAIILLIDWFAYRVCLRAMNSL